MLRRRLRVIRRRVERRLAALRPGPRGDGRMDSARGDAQGDGLPPSGARPPGRGPRFPDQRPLHPHLLPIDFAAVLANPVSLHPLGTDAADGRPVDLAALIRDVRTLKDALRATSCLPVMAGPPIELDGGRRFLDGGVAEPVPIRTALGDGATHALVLRTRRLDEQSEPPGALAGRVTSRWFRRHAPGALTAWDSRPARTLEAERFLAGLPTVLQIRPPLGSPSVSRIATDPALLGSAVASAMRQRPSCSSRPAATTREHVAQ